MSQKSITVLLQRLNEGEKDLLDDIYSQLYNDIKAIALNQINQLKTGETITPTVMANECYIKLAKQNNIDVHNRRHFLNYLAKSMRMLLIDILREKSSDKRNHITTTKSLNLIQGQENVNFDILEIDQLLEKIEKINPEYAEILQFKLIFSLTFKEISEVLEKSERHVMRLWAHATTLIMALSKDRHQHETNE